MRAKGGGSLSLEGEGHAEDEDNVAEREVREMRKMGNAGRRARAVARDRYILGSAKLN